MDEERRFNVLYQRLVVQTTSFQLVHSWKGFHMCKLFFATRNCASMAFKPLSIHGTYSKRGIKINFLWTQSQQPLACAREEREPQRLIKGNFQQRESPFVLSWIHRITRYPSSIDKAVLFVRPSTAQRKMISFLFVFSTRCALKIDLCTFVRAEGVNFIFTELYRQRTTDSRLYAEPDAMQTWPEKKVSPDNASRRAERLWAIAWLKQKKVG